MEETTSPQSMFSDPETDLIRDLLEREQKQLLTEIHHTATGSYRIKLRERLDLVVSLLDRFGPKAA